MEKQWTEQDLHSFVQAAQAVFDGVSLTEEQPEPGWQDESLQVDYELRGGRVDCVLRRIVEADGKRWKLQMSAPLAGNVLPEERMTPRERELCRDDMSHDFLTGVYNRQYLERVFGAKLEQWARQGRSAAVALVALDKGPQLCDTYGQPVMDQLHCFVGNQWKKSFDTPATRVVCRLTGSIFAVGCLDTDGKQLAEEMNVPLLGQIPIVQSICENGDKGTPAALNENSITGRAFIELAENVVKQTEKRNAEQAPTHIVEMKK